VGVQFFQHVFRPTLFAIAKQMRPLAFQIAM
jgi:hypothetical protein